jgi:hypothetical protein
MSFKDLKAKRDGRRGTTVTVPPAQPSETQPQDPERVSNAAPKGYDDLQDAWTLYKDLPSNVKIQETAERGRGLWAIESISAGPSNRIYSWVCVQPGITGRTIITTKPRVHALSIRYLSSHCSNCISEATRRCSQCRTVRYCSAK